MTLAGLGPLFPAAVLHLSRSSRAVELSCWYPGTRRVLTRSVILRPRPTPGHGRSCWAGTPDDGMLRFQAVFPGSRGPFSISRIFKSQTLSWSEAPTERVKHPPPGSSCPPAVRPSGNKSGRLAGSRGPSADYSSRQAARRASAQPLPEDGRGTAWTTTPKRSRAAPLRQAAARGLGGAGGESSLLRSLWRGARPATWTTRGRREKRCS